MAEGGDRPARCRARGSDISLLGHSYLRSISDVQIKGDKMILH